MSHKKKTTSNPKQTNQIDVSLGGGLVAKKGVSGSGKGSGRVMGTGIGGNTLYTHEVVKERSI